MVKRLVVDASVAIKWLVPQQPEEADVPQALALMMKVDGGEFRLHQPPHFVAEVMGVVARICPEEAPGILRDLLNAEMCREESSVIYATATELSVQLRHHLFDTLYHATSGFFTVSSWNADTWGWTGRKTRRLATRDLISRISITEPTLRFASIIPPRCCDGWKTAAGEICRTGP